jgi:hypothetical protein
MNLPAVLFAVRLLIRDTFRQAIASGVFWLMLGVSVLCIVLCANVRVEGDLPLRAEGDITEYLSRAQCNRAAAIVANAVALGAGMQSGSFPLPAAMFSKDYQQIEVAMQHNVPVIRGQLTLAFGAIPTPIARDREHAVHFLQLQLAAWVADAAGLLLALVWTAGFLPTFLEPSAASVLLAKPLPRGSLLAGKYLGVLTFVGLQSVFFIGGTWLTLALRTGVWDATYLLCIPVLLIHFAIFFSFSVLLAVATRSTVACVFGSVVFWLLCWGMNYGRHALVGMPDLAETSSALGNLVEIGYWILPKPADLGILLFNALEAGQHFGQLSVFEAVQNRGAFLPEWSIITSLLFMICVLAVAARKFVTTDY